MKLGRILVNKFMIICYLTQLNKYFEVIQIANDRDIYFRKITVNLKIYTFTAP